MCISFQQMSVNLCREADQLLLELKQPQEYSSLLSESFLDSSSVLEISGQGTPSTSSDQTVTMRVRCRGKIHRFTINKVQMKNEFEHTD